MSERLCQMWLRCNGYVRENFRAGVDPGSPKDLRRVLVDAVKRNGGYERDLEDYSLEVEAPRERPFTFTATFEPEKRPW